LYVVDDIVPAKSVPKSRWAENAHTRRVPGDGDIVVRAKPGVSGRLRRCIPIGELRDRVYRVRNDLLDVWGGLDIKTATFTAACGCLPSMTPQILPLVLAQKPELVAENNPA